MAALLGVTGGLVGVVTVAVDGTGDLGGGFTSSKLTIYGPGQGVLAVALVCAAMLLYAARRRDAAGACLVVVALCTAQLAGTGLVGFRRWPLFRGASAPAP